MKNEEIIYDTIKMLLFAYELRLSIHINTEPFAIS